MLTCKWISKKEKRSEPPQRQKIPELFTSWRPWYIGTNKQKQKKKIPEKTDNSGRMIKTIMQKETFQRDKLLYS